MVSEMTLTLDETSRSIIRLLQMDGRRARDIAKEVGLSEAAVRQRVRRPLRPRSSRSSRSPTRSRWVTRAAAMIAISVDGDVQHCAKLIGEIDEVDYLVSTAGGIDLFAEVFATDDDHLFL